MEAWILTVLPDAKVHQVALCTYFHSVGHSTTNGTGNIQTVPLCMTTSIVISQCTSYGIDRAGVEQSIAKQPKRFWKRLSIGDKSGKGDNDQVMLKGFQSHSEKPPSSIPEAVQQDPSSSKAATHLDSEAPAVPPYKPSSPDSFPLSNQKGYVAQQQEGKAPQSGSASNVELVKKGGGGTGLTSQQLKAMRRLSIQGQSVSL